MRGRAFTLMEVLLTIAVLGLIIAFTFADYGRIAASRSLEESSDRLRTLVVRVQAESMRSGLKYRIMFPGTPDPLDLAHRDEKVDIPIQTAQPSVERQADPLGNPDLFTSDFTADWAGTSVLQQ